MFIFYSKFKHPTVRQIILNKKNNKIKQALWWERLLRRNNILSFYYKFKTFNMRNKHGKEGKIGKRNKKKLLEVNTCDKYARINSYKAWVFIFFNIYIQLDGLVIILVGWFCSFYNMNLLSNFMFRWGSGRKIFPSTPWLRQLLLCYYYY